MKNAPSCFNSNLSESETMSQTEFISQAARLKKWCQTALEFWYEHCADPRGGYAEFLHMDGRADFDHIRRVRVQARQAYVYAHAAYVGWYSKARPACDQAWDFLTGPGFAGGDYIAGAAYTGPRGCAHLVQGDGRLHDDMRDLYAQAFVLLSGAWRYRAFGDDAALLTAEGTLSFINSYMSAENGGWFEALPAPESPLRRQNPHMHLFEAMLALYGATQDKRYLASADELYGLFKEHFFEPKTGGVLEFFCPHWKPHPVEGGDGGPLEPGHMMEWCWLLRSYEKLSGIEVGFYADALYESAIKFGWNERLGLLCNAVKFDGSPSNPNLRSWPQTELIKASVAQATAGQADKLSVASEAIKAMFETYLNVSVTGGWADELNPDGQIISNIMPTSTFYHLFCAAIEADGLARKLR